MLRLSIKELLNYEFPKECFINALCMSEKYKLLKTLFLISDTIDKDYDLSAEEDSILIEFSSDLFIRIDENFNLNFSDDLNIDINKYSLDDIKDKYFSFVNEHKETNEKYNVIDLRTKEEQRLAKQKEEEEQRKKAEEEKRKAIEEEQQRKKAKAEEKRKKDEEKKKQKASTYSSSSYSYSYSTSYKKRSYGRRCPYCGASLVLRHRRSDGHPFYGCSNFPSCRYTENV